MNSTHLHIIVSKHLLIIIRHTKWLKYIKISQILICVLSTYDLRST